jgi:predicted MFS family arabinose efflux permease
LMAVVTPVRNSLIPNLVLESQVASAVAVDSAVRNLSRILGPAIAGTLLAVMEVADVFWISGCSIVAVLLSLVIVRAEASRDADSNELVLKMEDGFGIVTASW